MFEYESKHIASAGGARRLELVVTGTLTIESAARLKELLLAVIGDNQNVVLDMAGVKDLDFSVMQLLCATNKYAQKMGKHFALRNQCTEKFIDRAQSLGLLRDQACNEAEDPNKCLWIPANLS